MRKGFTLVELLIVVVIIVTLMAITFRISGIATDTSRRNQTIARLQRIENALSGYYAAFGSYPPVDLYHSRNVYLKANERTLDQEDTETQELEWPSVNVACMAQPFTARFPFSKKMDNYIDVCSKVAVKRVNSTDPRYKGYKEYSQVLGGGFGSLGNPNSLMGWTEESSWDRIKVFQFGVMSFLMPRYMFMLDGIDMTNRGILDTCKQWNSSNRLPANPNNGETFDSWRTVFDEDRASLLRRLPSQSVCARWMPNLENSVVCSSEHDTFFGIRVRDADCDDTIPVENPAALAQSVFTVGSGGARYVLDRMTMHDGWGREFYYYSPAPFQSYRVWSAGPDGKTFPPWYPLEKLKNDTDRQRATSWMADDIMQMSN